MRNIRWERFYLYMQFSRISLAETIDYLPAQLRTGAILGAYALPFFMRGIKQGLLYIVLNTVALIFISYLARKPFPLAPPRIEIALRKLYVDLGNIFPDLYSEEFLISISLGAMKILYTLAGIYFFTAMFGIGHWLLGILQIIIFYILYDNAYYPSPYEMLSEEEMAEIKKLSVAKPPVLTETEEAEGDEE